PRVGGDLRRIEPESFHAFLLHHAGHRALCHRRGPIVAPGGCRARPRNETIARTSLPAVTVQRPRDAAAQPAGGLLGAVEFQHQNDSSTASTTICGLTFMSGCTPSSRSVCCTVVLNTGAATSPPKYLPADGSSSMTATMM